MKQQPTQHCVVAPDLKWYVNQKKPLNEEEINDIQLQRILLWSKCREKGKMKYNFMVKE